MILFSLPCKLDRTSHEIDNGERSCARHLQSYNRRSAFCDESIAVCISHGGKTSGINERCASSLGGLALQIKFLRSGKISIRMPRRQKRFNSKAVTICSLGLKIRFVWPAHSRPFVPINTQPEKAVKNRLKCFVNVASGVGVVNPQNECAAVMSSKKPIKECCAHTANVQITSRTRGKTGAYSHKSFF